jgi:hypothetical protein
VANVLPDGGRGIGVNPRGTDYPFVRPSPDVKGLLADAYLAYDRPDAALPLRVARLAGFGAAFLGLEARCDVEVRDAAGAVVFDSTAAPSYRAAPAGPRLRVHEWLAPAAVLRVVQHTAFPDDPAVVAVPDVIVPGDGTLDARVGQVMARRVLRVRDPDTGTAVAGDLAFANGYNTTIEAAAAARGLRAITQLSWTAEAGGGLGRYPGCVAPELVLRSFNRVGPADDGDFQLAADGCYWARQPTEIAGWPRTSRPVAATLHLGNDCGPCCDCADFVRVQRGILRTWGRFVAIGRQAESVRDAFAGVIARWQEERDCIEARVVSLALAPFGGTFVEVVAGICNHTRFCLYDTTLVITVEGAPGGGSVPAGATQISIPGRGMVPYQMVGAWPAYTAYFDAIQAMTNGALRTRFKIPAATAGAAVTVRAAAATAAPLAGLRLPQEVRQTVTFGI